MTPNWFIALPVEADPWFDAVTRSPPGVVSCFSPHDLHLTVAFLRGCGEEAAQLAWMAAEEEVRDGPFDVTLAGVEPFGNPKRPSALAAVLATGRGDVESFIARSRDAMFDAADVPRDTRPARAHITVARPARRASNAERQEALEWGASLDLGGARLRLNRLALYTWSEDRDERLFRIVEVRELR